MTTDDVTQIVLGFDRPVSRLHMDRITEAVNRINHSDVDLPRLETIYRAFEHSDGHVVRLGEDEE